MFAYHTWSFEHVNNKSSERLFGYLAKNRHGIILTNRDCTILRIGGLKTKSTAVEDEIVTFKFLLNVEGWPSCA